MKGLVKRGGVWLYQREVPRRLRSIIGNREVKRTLGTADLNAAQRRWQTVNAAVDRLFAESGSRYEESEHRGIQGRLAVRVRRRVPTATA